MRDSQSIIRLIKFVHSPEKNLQHVQQNHHHHHNYYYYYHHGSTSAVIWKCTVSVMQVVWAANGWTCRRGRLVPGIINFTNNDTKGVFINVIQLSRLLPSKQIVRERGSGETVRCEGAATSVPIKDQINE